MTDLLPPDPADDLVAVPAGYLTLLAAALEQVERFVLEQLDPNAMPIEAYLTDERATAVMSLLGRGDVPSPPCAQHSPRPDRMLSEFTADEIVRQLANAADRAFDELERIRERAIEWAAARPEPTLSEIIAAKTREFGPIFLSMTPKPAPPTLPWYRQRGDRRTGNPRRRIR